MISKLPPWIGFGAWALAFIAGMINVVGFIGFQHQAITHLTGTTSMLAAAAASGRWSEAVHFGASIAAFVAGAALSGIMVKDTALQLGRNYGAALFLECLLLCAAVPLFEAGSGWAVYCAACACGLQNGMVSTYSGAVVRTTHVSGMFTDLGIYLGHAIRRLPVDARRLRLCVIIISAFFCGGVAGTLAFQELGYKTLFVPAGLVAALAVGYPFLSEKEPRKEA